MAITVLTIGFTSLLSYSTVFGQEGLPDDIGFLEVEGNRLNDLVGGWMGPLFWTIGAFSLFAGSIGIVDYTSRLAADVLRRLTGRTPRRAACTSASSGRS